MLTISKPLSAGQAQTYHQKEFTAKEQNYWSQRLHLSALQRHTIWVVCYQKYRAPELSVARR